MRLIYIAGAYRAKNAYERQCNINRAWEAGAALIAHPDNHGRVFPIIPHLNTVHYEDLECEKYFVDGTMETMTRWDGAFNIDANEAELSEGVRGEICKAGKLNMPIFLDLDAVFYSDWEG